jgi:predicted transcriptional regulator
MGRRIRGLTDQIVSAYISNNDVSANQIPRLIRNVHHVLATVGQARAGPIKAEPVVAVKKSVFTDRILCLDCGASLKMLRRHLARNHQMTPEEYRAKWNLPASYPMVAAEYAAMRSQIAKDIGLGRKVEAPPPARPAKKARSGGRSKYRPR